MNSAVPTLSFSILCVELEEEGWRKYGVNGVFVMTLCMYSLEGN